MLLGHDSFVRLRGARGAWVRHPPLTSGPAARTFQQAMFAQSIPLAAFEVSGIEEEYARLKNLGNLIQMYQKG